MVESNLLSYFSGIWFTDPVHLVVLVTESEVKKST